MHFFEWFVGLRYTRARRRNHFISFISLVSMLGIALGVAALIVVLSVMNGFQHELRSRILGVAAHVEISGDDGHLTGWPAVMQMAMHQPGVLAAAPYIDGQAMIGQGQAVQGVLVQGIDPALETRVADLASHMKSGRLEDLQPGGFGIILGSDLARNLQVRVGDHVTIITPQGQVTPAGMLPRIKEFHVVGIFSMGMYEYDNNLAFIDLHDAAVLYRLGDAVTGVRLKLADLDRAPQVSSDLDRLLPPGQYATDWTQQHVNYFKAVRMEKTVMFVILLLIVAVAAFNIVSTLVMVVTDKQSDIAILRTLGASPASIMRIFMIQGTLIGSIGTVTGIACGVVVALEIHVIVPALEKLLGVHFLAKDVYYISELPSRLEWRDVVIIAITSFVLTFLATLYPSWRAARTQPAEALRYE